MTSQKIMAWMRTYCSKITAKAVQKVLQLNAFYHFQNNKTDFLNHYHKRSNVETTFMAIKRKFGETLKSKNTTAQVNELLCKILAYNITVLINCMYTKNIDPVFLKAAKETERCAEAV